MNLPDFPRSFMTFTVPGRANTARIQIDARCVLTRPGSGEAETFVLITPCKSEEMYVREGLFKAPNYDFCGIWSEKEYLILRTYPAHDPANEGEWEAGPNSPRFEEVKIDIRSQTPVEPLRTDAQVVRATLGNLPLLARTRLRYGDTEAVIDYPVKTMNICEGTERFQVDTGPVPVPDMDSRAGRAVERFAMAFVCYNTFDAAEFVLREKTAVPQDGEAACKVMHYSRIVRMSARHELFCVGAL
ncbi:MAG: hypothetical protein IT210_04000 [Armatimonadetes bacterium]|nr:hypothetical protein [Armatimonadota bacterium]